MTDQFADIVYDRLNFMSKFEWNEDCRYYGDDWSQLADIAITVQCQ